MTDKMTLQEAIDRVEVQDASGRHGCDCETCIRARELVLDAAKLWLGSYTPVPGLLDIRDVVRTGDNTQVF